MSPLLLVLLQGLLVGCSKKSSVLLAVTNSSPAVLQSVVTFKAQLSSISQSNDLSLFPDKYRFEWKDSSEQYGTVKENTTAYIQKSTLRRIYNKTLNKAGDFSMTVKVFKGGSKKKLAIGTTKVTLTEHIDGTLRVSQDSTIMKLPPDMFRAGEPMMANFVEKEDFLGQRYSYTYHWTIESEGTNETRYPFFSYSIYTPGDYAISVLVVVKIVTGDHHPVTLNGHFMKHIVVKEPISSLTHNGTGSSVIDRPDHISINCSASGPVALTVCWNDTIGRHNNTTCVHTMYEPRCLFTVTHTFTAIGKFVLMLTLRNDVSVYESNFTVTVFDPPDVPSGGHHYLVLVLFSFLTVFIIAAAAIFIHIQRRHHRHIEVADFQFNSDIEDSIDGPEDIITKATRKMKRLLRSSKTNKGRPPNVRSTAVKYSALYDTL